MIQVHGKGLTVRECSANDVALIADYWFAADNKFLTSMGIDPAKMPDRTTFIQGVQKQITAPYAEKSSYPLIWEIGGVPTGHSNLSDIEYCKTAKMHLHMWRQSNRNHGYGLKLVQLSIPFYFEHFSLEALVCEPYAENTAPNKTLEKLGFKFEKRYRTIPGYICFEQEVNRYSLSKSAFDLIRSRWKND